MFVWIKPKHPEDMAAEQKRRETTARLAREMGLPNPLRGA